MQSLRFVSTAELARRTGVSRITAWRTCMRNPGFAVRVGGTFRIPEAHVRRVERGELPAAIAVVWTPVPHQKRIQRSLVSNPAQPRPATSRGSLLARRPIPSWLKLLGKCVAGAASKSASTELNRFAKSVIQKSWSYRQRRDSRSPQVWGARDSECGPRSIARRINNQATGFQVI